MSIDTLSSRDEKSNIFGRAISEAFEPYLSLWVESQAKYVLIDRFPQIAI
jgi:hypothetical protein